MAELRNTAGNQAAMILVERQTLNLGGGVSWLQEMDLSQLHTARERLLRTSRHHENRTWIPLTLTLLVYGLTLWVLTQIGGHLYTLAPADRWTFALLALPIGWLVGFSLWDIRRRSQQVMRVADQRLAEVVVEIAMRTPLAPRNHWWSHPSHGS